MITDKWIGRVASLVLALGTVSIASFASAATAPTGGVSHASSTNSQQLFSKYESLATYEATIKSTILLQPVNGSAPNSIESTMNVSYQKPNLLRVDEQGLMGGGEIVSNGQTIYSYSALTNQYSQSNAPHDLLRTFVMAKGETSNLKLVGHTMIDGKAVSEYHGNVHSSRGDSTVDMYIDVSTKLFRRVVAHMSQLPGPQGASFRMTMTQDFLNQKINPAISASVFKFTPPSGAQKGATGGMSAIPGMPGSQ